MSPPHPIPYQGSKRGLAHAILRLFPWETARVFEPFAGSAAVSLAVAAARAAVGAHVVGGIILNDANEPLMRLWEEIVHAPEALIAGYERHWRAQSGRESRYYDAVRAAFNQTRLPVDFFYLLTRCVKAAVRYNAKGEFNQSPDHRRRGAKPETVARHVLHASRLLRDAAILRRGDFRQAIDDATPADVLYLDPPYQGVCGAKDSRYLHGVSFEDVVEALSAMNRRNLSFIVSYDGRAGSKTYGRALPVELGLTRIEIRSGVSSQATLLGRRVETTESLYISPALLERSADRPFLYDVP